MGGILRGYGRILAFLPDAVYIMPYNVNIFGPYLQDNLQNRAELRTFPGFLHDVPGSVAGGGWRGIGHGWKSS